MYTIRAGSMDDLNILTSLRMEFLREAGNITGEVDVAAIELANIEYSKRKINNGFMFWLAIEDEKVIGTSGLVFLERPPLGGNLSGIEGYIMNMYTLPGHRRKGVATALINSMVKNLKDRDIKSVHLHATDNGRPVYEKLGFCQGDSEMVLNL